jgi:hypothetical protein
LRTRNAHPAISRPSASVPECRHPACRPPSGGRSSTRGCVPGRDVRGGRSGLSLVAPFAGGVAGWNLLTVRVIAAEVFPHFAPALPLPGARPPRCQRNHPQDTQNPAHRSSLLLRKSGVNYPTMRTRGSRTGGWRFDPINAFFTPAAHCIAMRPAFAARAPMPGASLRRGRPLYIHSIEWSPTGRGARRSNPAREAGARIGNPLFTPAGPIATFRCAAPARCGAFADERRVMAGGEGGGPTKADAKRSSGPPLSCTSPRPRRRGLPIASPVPDLSTPGGGGWLGMARSPQPRHGFLSLTP